MFLQQPQGPSKGSVRGCAENKCFRNLEEKKDVQGPVTVIPEAEARPHEGSGSLSPEEN